MNWITQKISEDGTLLYKGWSIQVVGYVMLGTVALLIAVWFLQKGTSKRWLRGITAFMRLMVVVMLALALMDPVVRSQKLIPQQSYLAHVFDVSQSMSIEDMDGTPRLDATAEIATQGSEVRNRLDEMYRHVEYTFDTSTNPLSPELALVASDQATDIEAALRNVQFQVSGLPLSGIVLYTDGNSSVGANVDSMLETARDLDIPIYTVGTAPQTPGDDLWIQEVIHPVEIADHVSTRITVLVGARGMKGQTARVVLLEGGSEVDSKSAFVMTDDQIVSFNFDVRPGSKEYVAYKVKVIEDSRESYPWNNEEQFFMTVSGKERRVLFVEGSPRYEYRFLRAAFDNDERFNVVSLVYVTKTGDFYRQGIEDSTELSKGFPATEEELFAYDVVVIGDIHASKFSDRQLLTLRQFVRKRGGGLLFLAGKESFAANGFGDTVLSAALPFQFHDPRQSVALDRKRTVTPSALGKERSIFGPYDPVLDFEPPWAVLPELDGLYPLYELKPGAQVLCEVSTGASGLTLPIVAHQRYGKGVALACGIAATWQWKFQTPSDDPSYQAFWKEMVLILMEGQQELIQVGASPGVVPIDGETSIRGTLLNETFELNRIGAVSLTIAKPDGTFEELTPRPSTKEGFTFEQVFRPQEPGIYRVKARSTMQSTGTEIEHETVFLATDESRELADVNLNDSLLRKISDTTGGEYVHLSEYALLPDKLVPREGSLYTYTEESAWDSKWILIGLLSLLTGEWLIRRIGGLA